jgi:signal transduction histidine kinase
MFFDPVLIAATSSEEIAGAPWVAAASATPDPTLAAAMTGADRAVIVSAVAALALVFALVMIARAVIALDKVSALRTEFVSSVTHELKTPLATIRAIGETLVSGRLSAPAAQREYAEMVVQQCKHLSRLIDNLLALSRITDVTQVYWFEPLPLDPLVRKTLAGFSQPLTAAGFSTHVDLPPGLPPVRGDRTALGLMLENLIDNAIRYSPGERALTIAARAHNGSVVLTVSDKGSGIPHDEIPRVTEKFFRGNAQPSTGSGLGLAIVRRVVEDHGGTLRISSVVNEGTAVEVSLPASHA